MIKLRYTILLTILVSCVLAVQQVSAQAEPAPAGNEISPLKVGDKIPDALWDEYFPVVSSASEKTELMSLGDYKDKLIILDFWATWCAPCISSLNKLDSLQLEFTDDLLVFPTSYEPEQKVRAFFKSKGWQLPTAFNETLLKNYFPYKAIPHQVWIKDGSVMAITGGEASNRKNIQETITDVNFHIREKESRALDADKPLLIDGNGGDGSDLIYHSILTKRLKTQTSGTRYPHDRGVRVYNATLEDLLMVAYGNQIDKLKRRIIWEIPDEQKTILLTGGHHPPSGVADADEAYYQWADENVYAYEIDSKVELGKDVVLDIMRADLNRYFSVSKGVMAALETHPFRTLVLVQADPSKSIATAGGKRTVIRNKEKGFIIQNQRISMLVNTLLEVQPDAMTDHTTSYDRIDIKLSSAIVGDLDQANRELDQYGLKLVEETRPLEVLIVKPYQQKRDE